VTQQSSAQRCYPCWPPVTSRSSLRACARSPCECFPWSFTSNSLINYRWYDARRVGAV